jgi:hypothetical protein
MSDEVARRLADIQDLLQRIDERLRAELTKLGFAEAELVLRSPAEAKYRLESDPLSQCHSLAGAWLDARGYQQGSLLFHADGSFFVEQDVIRNHPTRKGWFVEAVNAWGKGAEIKVEARLLPLPD